MLDNRFKRSWQVAKDSYRVLIGNPALMVFPILSGIAVCLVSIPFIALMAITGWHGHGQHFAMDTLHYVVTALSYFANYFVIVFFNAALVACANEALQGRKTTLGYGINAALSRLPQIIGWAALASTVGTLLRFIGERLGFVGAIVTGILGIAWNIAVFFVVPVLVIDRESPVSALKTSAELLKKTWGERLIIGIGAGYAILVALLVGVIPLALMVFFLVNNLYLLGALAGVGLLLYILAVSVVGSAITAIYQTALYLYCRNGSVPVGFGEQSMMGAFAPKPERRVFGVRM